MTCWAGDATVGTEHQKILNTRVSFNLIFSPLWLKFTKEEGISSPEGAELFGREFLIKLNQTENEI